MSGSLGEVPLVFVEFEFRENVCELFRFLVSSLQSFVSSKYYPSSGLV